MTKKKHFKYWSAYLHSTLTLLIYGFLLFLLSSPFFLPSHQTAHGRLPPLPEPGSGEHVFLLKTSVSSPLSPVCLLVVWLCFLCRVFTYNINCLRWPLLWFGAKKNWTESVKPLQITITLNISALWGELCFCCENLFLLFSSAGITTWFPGFWKVQCRRIWTLWGNRLQRLCYRSISMQTGPGYRKK